MDLKTGHIPGVLFPGIPALNSRETGMPKIREFPGISRPGIPGRQHYTQVFSSAYQDIAELKDFLHCCMQEHHIKISGSMVM